MCYLDVALDDAGPLDEEENELLYANLPLLALNRGNAGERSKIDRESMQTKVHIHIFNT